MMIMALLSGNIVLFSFLFILLRYLYRLYKPVDIFLRIVDRKTFRRNDRLIHRKPITCHQRISSLEDLFEDVIVVVDLGVFFAQ